MFNSKAAVRSGLCAARRLLPSATTTPTHAHEHTHYACRRCRAARTTRERAVGTSTAPAALPSLLCLLRCDCAARAVRLAAKTAAAVWLLPRLLLRLLLLLLPPPPPPLYAKTARRGCNEHTSGGLHSLLGLARGKCCKCWHKLQVHSTLVVAGQEEPPPIGGVHALPSLSAGMSTDWMKLCRASCSGPRRAYRRPSERPCPPAAAPAWRGLR